VLAGYACERALEYALQGLAEDEVRSRVAKDVNDRVRAIIERDKVYAERLGSELLILETGPDIAESLHVDPRNHLRSL